MKTFVTVLLAMMLGIVAMTSCEKDEPAEPKGTKYTYGDSLEVKCQRNNNMYAYQLFLHVGDTAWPLDADGNPIKRRDPATGELQYLYIVYTEPTVAQQMGKVVYSAVESLIQERDMTLNFFIAHPSEKIIIEFPKETRIISRVTEDGKSFEKEIKELDNIRQRLVDYPTHTLSQENEIIHKAAEPTFILINKDDFIEIILDPKFAAKTTKSILNQIAGIDQQQIEDAAWVAFQMIKRGEKLNENNLKEITKCFK